jgi:hypothetical protein
MLEGTTKKSFQLNTDGLLKKGLPLSFISAVADGRLIEIHIPREFVYGYSFYSTYKKKVLIRHSSLLFVLILDMNDKNNRGNAKRIKNVGENTFFSRRKHISYGLNKLKLL